MKYQHLILFILLFVASKVSADPPAADRDLLEYQLVFTDGSYDYTRGFFISPPALGVDGIRVWNGATDRPMIATMGANLVYSGTEVQVVNLTSSNIANASSFRTGIGLGSSATQASTAFDAAGAASAAQAAAIQRANHTGTQAASTITGLATVATTGAYANLSGTPTALSLTTTGSGAATFNGGTGVLNVPTPSSSKRQETYSISTNSSGVSTVTFGTAYGAAPNIQLQATNFSSDNQFLRVTAISTTGFSVIARLRTDIAGLLPSFSNINAATADVLITEK